MDSCFMVYANKSFEQEVEKVFFFQQVIQPRLMDYSLYLSVPSDHQFQSSLLGIGELVLLCVSLFVWLLTN